MLFFGETNVPRGCKVLRANGQMSLSIVKWVTTESNVFKKSNTCSVFPGNGIYWVLKVRHGLVAQVEVIVSGFIHQVTTVQVSSDHLFFCHSSGQELYWQQGETHLRDDNPQWDYFIRVQSVKKHTYLTEQVEEQHQPGTWSGPARPRGAVGLPSATSLLRCTLESLTGCWGHSRTVMYVGVGGTRTWSPRTPSPRWNARRRSGQPCPSGPRGCGSLRTYGLRGSCWDESEPSCTRSRLWPPTPPERTGEWEQTEKMKFKLKLNSCSWKQTPLVFTGNLNKCDYLKNTGSIQQRLDIVHS